MVTQKNEAKQIKWHHETEYGRTYNKMEKRNAEEKVLSLHNAACQTENNHSDEQSSSRRPMTADAGVQTSARRIFSDLRKQVDSSQQTSIKINKDIARPHSSAAILTGSKETVMIDGSKTLYVPMKSSLEPPMQGKKTVFTRNNHNLCLTDTTKQVKLFSNQSDAARKVVTEPTMLQSEAKEPNLQRKRIVPYERNHNIFCTRTIPVTPTKMILPSYRSNAANLKEEEHVSPNREHPFKRSTYTSEFTWKMDESPIIKAAKARRALFTRPVDKRLMKPTHQGFIPKTTYDDGNFETEYNSHFLLDRSTRPPVKPPLDDDLMSHYNKVIKDRIAAYSPSKRLALASSEIATPQRKEKREWQRMISSPASNRSTCSNGSYTQSINNKMYNNRDRRGSVCSSLSESDSVYSKSYNPLNYSTTGISK